MLLLCPTRLNITRFTGKGGSFRGPIGRNSWFMLKYGPKDDEQSASISHSNYHAVPNLENQANPWNSNPGVNFSTTAGSGGGRVQGVSRGGDWGLLVCFSLSLSRKALE